MLLYAYQQNQSAGVFFERARALDPREFRWTYYLASVQAALGDPVQSLSNFREAVRLKPDYPPAQLKLAETLLAAGKSAESQQLYETILHKDPDSPWAHYGLGRVKSGQTCPRHRPLSQSLRDLAQLWSRPLRSSLGFPRLGRQGQGRRAPFSLSKGQTWTTAFGRPAVRRCSRTARRSA